MPRCQRCAQHNVHNRLKGHKRACPFLDCHCAKCQVVLERQRLMADQIKLRRRQKKQKKAVIERSENLLQPSSEHAHLPPFLLPTQMMFHTQTSNPFHSDMQTIKGLFYSRFKNTVKFCST